MPFQGKPSLVLSHIGFRKAPAMSRTLLCSANSVYNYLPFLMLSMLGLNVYSCHLRARCVVVENNALVAVSISRSQFHLRL